MYQRECIIKSNSRQGIFLILFRLMYQRKCIIENNPRQGDILYFIPLYVLRERLSVLAIAYASGLKQDSKWCLWGKQVNVRQTTITTTTSFICMAI